MRACIIGGTGYGGVELIRLLHNHSEVELVSIASSSQQGGQFSDSYPHMIDVADMTLDPLDIDLISSKAEVVFLATPSGASIPLVPRLRQAGLQVIDLSGDYRLKKPGVFKEWYGKEPAHEVDLQQAVYGLSELFKDQIKGARFVSNPGCYPTAVLLGLAPLVKNGLVSPNETIIDAKSGVSGAGRGASLGTHYGEINENLKVYKVNKHQHIPEIEQALEWVGGQQAMVTFTTHLVPMTRGIMATMIAPMKTEITTQEVIELYREFYGTHPFVRVRPTGTFPSTKEVYGSNYCDIGLDIDARTGRITIVSVIDNLVKGAAGQALQNFNISNGMPETMGLEGLPLFP
jgi:N-acetyl-gamma-glutamyl-phosphate reductase